MIRLYDYKCPKCGFINEYITDVDLDEVFNCPKDGEVLERMQHTFNVNMGPVPLTGYYDDNLQSFVRTNNHRKQLMEQQGVTEKGATPKQGQSWV